MRHDSSRGTAVDDTWRRLTVFVTMGTDTNDAQAEGQIKERWDALVKMGYREGELRLLDGWYQDDRAGLAKALGALIAENTLAGRLQRAGLLRDDDDDRPGDDDEEG